MVRKSGCVRGVNLRLSQPEATMGCCGKTISSQAFSVKGRGQRGGVVMVETKLFMLFNSENREINY